MSASSNDLNTATNVSYMPIRFEIDPLPYQVIVPTILLKPKKIELTSCTFKKVGIRKMKRFKNREDIAEEELKSNDIRSILQIASINVFGIWNSLIRELRIEGSLSNADYSEIFDILIANYNIDRHTAVLLTSTSYTEILDVLIVNYNIDSDVNVFYTVISKLKGMCFIGFLTNAKYVKILERLYSDLLFANME